MKTLFGCIAAFNFICETCICSEWVHRNVNTSLQVQNRRWQEKSKHSQANHFTDRSLGDVN